VYRVKDNGKEPCDWEIEKFADIPYERWVQDILELKVVLNAGSISGEQREQVNDAIGDIVFEGLMPAYLELQEIKKLNASSSPLLNRRQPYEDLARKLWKAYKELMQTAVRLMGFDIGFLFQNDKVFRTGLEKFRQDNPNVNKHFERVLEHGKTGWQEKLYRFRNSICEHQGGTREDFEWFYEAANAEELFNDVWTAIAYILPMLLELKLFHGTRLVEQSPDDPGPRWPERFRFDMPIFRKQ
jgi:hypothetical protein